MGDKQENIRFKLRHIIHFRTGENFFQNADPIFHSFQITQGNPIRHILHSIKQKFNTRLMNVPAVPVLPDQINLSILQKSIHPGHKLIEVVPLHRLVINGTCYPRRKGMGGDQAPDG